MNSKWTGLGSELIFSDILRISGRDPGIQKNSESQTCKAEIQRGHP